MDFKMDRLKGKKAVVTGGGAGIGRAIALRFAAEGAHVIFLDRDLEQGEKVLEEILQNGGKGEFRSADVASLENLQKALNPAEEVDILVNNAGVASIGNLEDTDAAEMDRVYGVNVKGVYHCLSLIVPGMKKRGSGVILNLGSIASKIGIQDRFAYSMSKGAVLAMTLSVARDYVESGIRCNCICPARVRTSFVDNFVDKHYPDDKDGMLEKLSSSQPMGRMGTVDEVASLVLFLCSDEAAFITGSAYGIDGGVMNLR